LRHEESPLLIWAGFARACPEHAAAEPSGPRVSALASAAQPRAGLDGENGVVASQFQQAPSPIRIRMSLAKELQIRRFAAEMGVEQQRAGGLNGHAY